MKTAAIMTRIQLIEGPFLDEFIQWYLGIGFSKIYFINTEPHNLEKIKQFITPELLEKVHFTNYSGPVNSFGYAKKLFTEMNVDYVLHADSDEYLVIPPKYKNIGDFLDKNNFTRLVFSWLNVPVKKYYETFMVDYLFSPTATGHFCGQVKMMVNRKACLASGVRMNPHQFICGGTIKKFHDPGFSGNSPFLIHFLSRGYLHTSLKVLTQKLPTEKGKTSKPHIVAFLKDTFPIHIPFRFKIVAAEQFIAIRKPIDNLSKWGIKKQVIMTDYTDKIIEMINVILHQYNITEIKDLYEDIFNLDKKVLELSKKVGKKYPRVKIARKFPAELGKLVL